MGVRPWGIVLFLVAAALGAGAQTTNYAVNGACSLGGQATIMQGIASSGTRPLQGNRTFPGTGVMASYPGCTVTVYKTGTLVPAQIYLSASGGTLSNPFTANLTDGSFVFFAPAACYDIMISSGATQASTMPNPHTFAAVCAGAGGSSTPLGTTVTVNGTAAVPNSLNFNSNAPIAPGGQPLITWGLNGNNVSAWLQGNGDANSCLLGTGIFGPCPGAGSSGMAWPALAGIANYAGGNTWGTSYSASNPIPANFIAVLNQNTTGNAATATALAANPAICPSGEAAQGVLANGAATGCMVVGAGGSMTWPSGASGIPNYSGSSSWSTSYNASNPIPPNFISILNQSTTGNAATATLATSATALAGTPTLCPAGQAPTGILPNGNATGCAATGGGGGAGSGTVGNGTVGEFASYSATNTVVGNPHLTEDTTNALIVSSETVAAPQYNVTGQNGIAMTGPGGTLPTPATGQGGIGIGPSGVAQFWDGTTWENIGSGAGGVTSINGLNGPFTFTGVGVDCSSTPGTCTFSGGGSGGGTTVSINGTSGGSALNIANGTTPPANSRLINWTAISGGATNAYLQGSGNPTDCFLGNGTFGPCPGGGGGGGGGITLGSQVPICLDDSSQSATSLTMSGLNINAGDTVVVTLHQYAAFTVTSLIDSGGNSYGSGAVYTSGDTQIWAALNVTHQATTITASRTVVTAKYVMCVTTFRNVASISSNTGSNNGSTNSPQPSVTVTMGAAGNVLLGAITSVSSQTGSYGAQNTTPVTQVLAQDYTTTPNAATAGVCQVVAAAAGPVTCGLTSGNMAWRMAAVELVAGAGGGGGTGGGTLLSVNGTSAGSALNITNGSVIQWSMASGAATASIVPSSGGASDCLLGTGSFGACPAGNPMQSAGVTLSPVPNQGGIGIATGGIPQFSINGAAFAPIPTVTVMNVNYGGINFQSPSAGTNARAISLGASAGAGGIRNLNLTLVGDGSTNCLSGQGTYVACGGGSGSMTWPAAAGIPIYGGSSAWGTSLGTATDNVVPVVSGGAWTTSNAPALSAGNMTSFPTLNQNTTGNAATATSAAGITGNGTANQVWGMNSSGATQGWQTLAPGSTTNPILFTGATLPTTVTGQGGFGVDASQIPRIWAPAIGGWRAVSVLSINGGNVPGNQTNFSSTTPAAPANNTNVTWQVSGNNLSAYVPTAAGGSGTVQTGPYQALAMYTTSPGPAATVGPAGPSGAGLYWDGAGPTLLYSEGAGFNGGTLQFPPSPTGGLSPFIFSNPVVVPPHLCGVTTSITAGGTGGIGWNSDSGTLSMCAAGGEDARFVGGHMDFGTNRITFGPTLTPAVTSVGDVGFIRLGPQTMAVNDGTTTGGPVGVLLNQAACNMPVINLSGGAAVPCTWPANAPARTWGVHCSLLYQTSSAGTADFYIDIPGPSSLTTGFYRDITVLTNAMVSGVFQIVSSVDHVAHTTTADQGFHTFEFTGTFTLPNASSGATISVSVAATPSGTVQGICNLQ